MTDEEPLPTNRALLHAELSKETAKALVILTGSASAEAEMTALVAGAMAERLKDVAKELDGASSDMA